MEIEKVIESLTDRITNSGKAVDVLQITQAALNLAHVLAVLDNLDK